MNGLTINPNPIRVGDTIIVSIDCRNEGNKAGSHIVTLVINGEVEDEKTVTVAPNEYTTISFDAPTSEKGIYSVEIEGLTGSYEVVAPASFDVSNLVIDPESLMEDESVTISVECSNVGGVSGSYDVVLMIDGETEDTSMVALDADESTTVSFDVSVTQEGTYSVEIGDLTGSYTVNPQEPEPKPGGIPGFTTESVFMGLILGALILWISRR